MGGVYSDAIDSKRPHEEHIYLLYDGYEPQPSPEDFAAICRQLCSCPYEVRLSLYFTRLSTEQWIEFANCVPQSKITELTIRIRGDQKNEVDDIIHAIMMRCQESSLLHKFDFAEVDISPNSMQSIAQAMKDSRLDHLILGGSGDVTSVLEALPLSGIRYLHFYGMLDEPALLKLCSVLPHTRLKSLTLHVVDITPTVSKLLSDVLIEHPVLQHLEILSDRLQSSLVPFLSELPKTKITCLEIGWVTFTDESLVALAHAVKHMSQLTELRLGRSYGWTFSRIRRYLLESIKGHLNFQYLGLPTSVPKPQRDFAADTIRRNSSKHAKILVAMASSTTLPRLCKGNITLPIELLRKLDKVIGD